MKTWNLEQMVARLRHLLNSQANVVDQDFSGPSGDPDRHFRDALNEAYVEEVAEACQHADPTKWLHYAETIAWPQGQITLTLPATIESKNIISIDDVTTSNPGTRIWVGSSAKENTPLWWYDRNTLQWGATGASVDSNLLFTYIAEPQELTADIDEPVLIPRPHRHLLVWAAGVTMRVIGDEGAPKDWVAKREELRQAFWKDLSMGRPTTTGYPGIIVTNPDVYGPIW